MAAQWIFRELRPGDKDRQPTQGEFFATDAIKSVAEALVRESVQNTLDAGLKTPGQPVRVRFHLATGKHALPAADAQRYFKSGWQHFQAKGNGLDDVPSVLDSCPFLVVEDFGTTGLIGDINQWRHIPGDKNPFYFFFRTEGRSGKGEEDRGRWGVGKYVFPRSSDINAFMALTIRHDDSKCLLMGQAILKSHTVGTQYFTPDGDFGKDDGKGFVLPEDDKALLDSFSKDFDLKRTTEAGLSVVVPWVDATITLDGLLQSVIEDYFHPILAGELVVEISNGEKQLEVRADSLAETCKLLGAEFETKMLPILKLSEWARGQADDAFIHLKPASPDRPRWDAALIPAELIPSLREKFRAGEPMALKIPLTVREKKGLARNSFFKVFLMHDGSEEGNPLFIRDGIIISDVRAHWVTGVRSVVVVDHPPLAMLLGDSENPAHTQWQKDREHFRYKYTYGKSYIDFVTQSVSMFVRYLNESDEQPDKDLLREIFSIPKKPESDEAKEKSKRRKRNKGEVINPDPKVEPKKRRFTLSKIAGGFTITRGHPEALLPAVLEISVAYDRRRGSPLKKYVPADFRINEAPIKLESVGAKFGERQKNRLVVNIQQPDFNITVAGFDENRDLFVDVQVKEANDDSQA